MTTSSAKIDMIVKNMQREREVVRLDFEREWPGAEEFVRRFVLTRQPVVLYNVPDLLGTKPEMTGTKPSSPSSSSSSTSPATTDLLGIPPEIGRRISVAFEKRGGGKGSTPKTPGEVEEFGSQNADERATCALADFGAQLGSCDAEALDHVLQGAYLTTQPLPQDSWGRNAVLCGDHMLVQRAGKKKNCAVSQQKSSSSLFEVSQQFFHETLLGGRWLVPYQYNIWWGRAGPGPTPTCAAAATKTPLHHDYHDNFYYLAQGRKKFFLFPPWTGAKVIPTEGASGAKPIVHANGLIVYDASRRKRGGPPPIRSDGALAEAVRAWENNGREHNLKSSLPAASGKDHFFSSAAEQDSSSEEDRILEECLASAKRQRSPRTPNVDTKSSTSRRAQEPAAAAELPDHFSRFSAEELLQMRLSPESSRILQKETFVVDLVPGDLLYLPASWFHEVHSTAAGGHHLALNAWFHPPAARKVMPRLEDKNAETLYQDSFWASWYDQCQLPNTRRRMQQLNKRVLNKKQKAVRRWKKFAAAEKRRDRWHANWDGRYAPQRWVNDCRAIAMDRGKKLR